MSYKLKQKVEISEHVSDNLVICSFTVEKKLNTFNSGQIITSMYNYIIKNICYKKKIEQTSKLYFLSFKYTRTGSTGRLNLKIEHVTRYKVID